jgi:hypothetical protein
MKTILAIVAVIAFFALAFLWERFKYHECKKVGHGTFYCVMTSGSHN